jgi:hypothetical protein
VQRYHNPTRDVADQQPDDRPQRIGAEHDRKRPVHDRRDLQIRPNHNVN